ncbi:MAG: hypothetical protein L6R41_007861 [Letrouitia leprolyta]|nr:MAG: hypothetical protein L6R41_007861 [Letrouitia leprolyta]
MASAASTFSYILPDTTHRTQPRRRRQPRKPNSPSSTPPEEEVGGENRPDVGELRRRRAEYYARPPEKRRVSNQTSMAERFNSRRSSSVRIPPSKRPEIVIREVREHRPAESRHRRHKPRTTDEVEHVYVYHPRPSDLDPPPIQRSKTTRTAHAAPTKEVHRNSDRVIRTHAERRPSHHQEDETIIRRVVSVNRHPEPPQHPRSFQKQPPITRYSEGRLNHYWKHADRAI